MRMLCIFFATNHYEFMIIHYDIFLNIHIPFLEGSICAAPTENNWYRAQVISTSEENDTSVVKLVDFGGYLTVDNDQLKQIRSDFMTLPFQATEAILAFVKPANKGELFYVESNFQGLGCKP